MAYDKKKLAEALKILDTTPKEINRQREAYLRKLREIDAEEKKGIWGKVTLDNRRREAKAARDKTLNALTERMSKAFELVEQNNDYAGSETINFNDPKLNDALRLVELMGKDLSITDQAHLLNTHRGDIGALRVLEKAFSKNNLALKDTAKELQKPISSRAMNDMKEAIAFAKHYAATGNWTEDPFKRTAWTASAFSKQIDRLNLTDEAAGVDPYSAVIDALGDQLKTAREEAQYSELTEEERISAMAQADAEAMHLQLARNELMKAQVEGRDPAEVLNRQLDGMERRGTMPASNNRATLEAAYKAANLPFPKR